MTDSAPYLPAAPASAELSGRQLGDYRILRRIGRGAMADVYLAEQLSLGRQVAIKVLKRELAEDASYVKRFQNEARAAAALVHANIVQIHEVGCIDDVHFIAQEYVAGQNLRQLLDRQGPLDARLSVTIMRQVAAALHRAGRAGIVHRDIKPENIMLSAAGEVKVADFGLSRIAGDGGLDLTQVGVTMGTPLYMSPEQAEGKKPDPRSDLYSFGVTCFHMLAGRPPFVGDTALVVAMHHVRSSPERLENLRADVPEGLCRIVHKLLEKSPDERYPDAAALLKDLRELPLEMDDADWDEALDDWGTAELVALSQGRTDATQRLDSLMKTAALRTRSPGNRWLLALLAGVLAALLVGGLVAWVTRDGFLLDRTAGEAPPEVEKQQSAEAQYWHAMAQPTPEQRENAFLAVERHFPQDEYHVHRAQQQLARLYLARDDTRSAMKLCQQLASLPEIERRLRAFGLAGQAICYTRQGDSQQAAAKIKELLPLKDELDSEMRRQIDELTLQ